MSNKLGYVKILSIKIQRTKHCVGFRIGESVNSLIQLLAKVPTYAEVDEVLIDDEGIITIEFHHEKEDNGN